MSEARNRGWPHATGRCRWALACAWFGLGLSAGFGQVNLYVDPAGLDGTNDCRDTESPCATVGYALSQSSVNGDTLYLAAGVYTEAGLAIQSNITIRGAGAGLTILQAAATRAAATSRVLWVKSGVTAVVEDVTFRHGQTASGLPGVAAQGGAAENGAGLYVNGSAFLYRCLIYDNVTGVGGPGAAGFDGGRGGHGAGLYCDGLLALVDCVVSNNACGPGGAAGEGGRGGTGGEGAAVHVSGQALLDRSTFCGNQTGSGGTGANGGSAGSGVLWCSGQLTVRSSTISDNETGSGGAGELGLGGSGGLGAGLRTMLGAVAIVEYSTVADNRTGAGGTGLTNGAAGYGGGLYAATGTLSMTHSIVADNEVAAGGQGADIWGPWVSTGFMLVRDTNDWSVVGDVVTGQDPLLGALTQAGGLTPVRPIPFASPAVNAGDPGFIGPPLVDQRGVARVQGERIDLGAYELATTTLHVAVGGVDVDNDCRMPGAPCATLAHAVQQALPGDTILLGAGQHQVAGLDLDRSLTVLGMDVTNAILQAAASANLATQRLLSVAAGLTVTVQRLTLQHGHAPDGVAAGSDGERGGAIFNLGHLLLADCLIQSNRSGRGADQLLPGGSGGSGGHGGAVFNQGWLVISNTLMQFNQAGDGGHAGTDSSAGPGGNGGAIYNDNDSHLHIVRSRLHGNQAGAGGSNDVAGGEGGLGGAVANSSALTLIDVELDGNSAGPGGVVNEDVAGVGGSGGGLYNSGGPALIERSTLAFNQAGAGLESGFGGGLYNEAELAVENSTFYGNTAGGAGGGLWNGYVLTLRHCTVASNISATAGGGLFVDPGQITTATHVLVAGNLANDAGPDVQGELVGAGYVLVADSAGLTFAGASDLTGNQLDVVPLLLSFDWQGGFSRTLSLSGPSPGVDQGDPFFAGPPATDQRGEPRVQGTRIDIGAWETMSSGQDRDGDGMPDDWEFIHGLDPDDPGLTNALAGPAGDPDADGQDNLSEYIALTRPDLPLDFFHISGVQRTNAFEVSYWGVTGRLYTLHYLDEMTNTVWSQVSGQVDVPGTGSSQTLQEAPVANPRFYRVHVRLSE